MDQVCLRFHKGTISIIIKDKRHLLLGLLFGSFTVLHSHIYRLNYNNTTLVASNEGMKGVEDPLKEIDELEESNPLSAEEVISASLESGFLTEICDVSVTM